MKISLKGRRQGGTASGALLAAFVATTLGALSFEETLPAGVPSMAPRDIVDGPSGAGPEHLASLLAANRTDIERMKAGLAAGQSRPEWTRLRAAIDGAAHQRDASWSGLFWYTNLPDALAAAKREGKPVLSLRLLGRLDEELSCANSRYFRTALYANAAISDELRRNWILHWESVRPAPKVTIDFGDGRTLVRTITGNSLHYVLDTDGRAVDVLPGLWEPGTFLRMVREAAARAARMNHGGAVDSIAAASLDVPVGHLSPSPPFKENSSSSSSSSLPFKADLSSLSSSLSSSLDSNSISLMRAKASGIGAAAFSRLVAAFERTLAEDTRRNAEMRRRILPWLAGAPPLAALTERIYREAFLTPESDPWLGLLAPDAYAAIEGEPVSSTSGPDAMRAGALTESKMIVERPLLARMAPTSR